MACMIDKEYVKALEKRVKTNRIVAEFQDIALQLAELLDDKKHVSLYMKLAKQHSKQTLLQIAKDVAERKQVSRKGAYFMKVLKEQGILKRLKLKNQKLK
jgi:hypothetical protein